MANETFISLFGTVVVSGVPAGYFELSIDSNLDLEQIPIFAYIIVPSL